MNKKILITGVAGNLGSDLAAVLLGKGYDVIGVDNLTTGSLAKVNFTADNWSFIKCDVNHYEEISAVMLSRGFDYIFHYAAVVGVERTLNNPISVLEDIQGIKNIFSLAKNTTVKRVFFASSSEVYGEPVHIPQHEFDTPLNSRLPYAIVKNLAEAFARSYQNEYGLNYTVFRFFNTYGPNQSPDFVMSRFIQKALNNDDILIYGDGSQSRTFCYVRDNTDSVVSCLEGNHYINDTVNIGSDKAITIAELAQLVIERTRSKSRIAFLPPLKEGDMSRRLPDITRMRAVLPRPLISIEEGVDLMIKHHLDKKGLKHESNSNLR